MAKKKNPQDATLRNINALKKKLAKLQAQYKKLHTMFISYINAINAKSK